MKKYSLFVFLIFVLAASACKMPSFGGKTETNTIGDNTTKDSPVTASDNPRDDVIKAAKKFNEQNSFKANMNGSGGKNINMQIEYVAPDRYHIKAADDMEIIVVAKDTYLKQKGEWKKYPADLGDMIAKMKAAFSEEGMKSLKDVEYVGEESVNGQSALLYRYKGAAVKDMPTYTSKLWIGKDKGLPLQTTVEYAPGAALKEMKTTYDYDSKVEIESPTVN